MLNPEAPLPLYRQLAADLISRINSGQYRAGERLPSEPELAALHHIGRPTVRQATDLLIQRGLIERRRGSGTYVRNVEPNVDLFDLGGTIAAFKKGGLQLDTQLLERPSLKLVEDSSNPMLGQKAYSLARLGCLAKAPVLLEHIIFNADVFAGLHLIELKGQSLSQLVERFYHLTPNSCRQVFTVGPVPGPWVQTLDVAHNARLLVIRRTLDFPGAEGACFSTMYCRTDRVQFIQTLRGRAGNPC